MKFIFSLILIVSVHVSGICYEKTLSICAIFKNEARFLSEWIDYHRCVGVEEFWLYNNNSEDEYQVVLSPYISKGIVHVIEWPSVHQENDWFHHSFEVQAGAYTNCLFMVKGRTKWLALIDVDEFIVPVCEESVPLILEKDFSDVSGLGINWILFGTSFVQEVTSQELMVERLILRAPISHPRNLIYKSIVQPDHVERCTHPHFCLYKESHWHVNTNREKIGDCAAHSVCVDKLKIHHYWSKDERFFGEQKIARYRRWGLEEKEILGMIEEKDSLNIEKDTEMYRFVERIKEIKKSDLCTK